MIHELLDWCEPEGSHRILSGIMLIGGPNQSHKVNFKEPPLKRGKISKRTFAFCSVNPFPETFEKSFVKEPSASRFFARLARDHCEVLNAWSREHVNPVFIIKTFLEKNLMILYIPIHQLDTNYYSRTCYQKLCPRYMLIFRCPAHLFWYPHARYTLLSADASPHSITTSFVTCPVG